MSRLLTGQGGQDILDASSCSNISLLPVSRSIHLMAAGRLMHCHHQKHRSFGLKVPHMLGMEEATLTRPFEG